jgi:hypothetical protein
MMVLVRFHIMYLYLPLRQYPPTTYTGSTTFPKLFDPRSGTQQTPNHVYLCQSTSCYSSCNIEEINQLFLLALHSSPHSLIAPSLFPSVIPLRLGL